MCFNVCYLGLLLDCASWWLRFAGCLIVVVVVIASLGVVAVVSCLLSRLVGLFGCYLRVLCWMVVACVVFWFVWVLFEVAC